ncbi:MAG: Lrp/AsnC family transcriptional regulator [Candidatus Bathyarchaeia archaeon]
MDLKILSILQENSRTSLTAIERKLGVSRFVIRSRLNRLFEEGAIHKPSIIIDPATLGYRRIVFFEFKTNPHEPWLARFLESLECCENLDGIAGEYSLLARFRFKGDDEFSSVLKSIDRAMARSTFKKYRFLNVIHRYKESGVVFDERLRKESMVDEIDLMILAVLQNQQGYAEGPLPITLSEVSKVISRSGRPISQPAVHRRIKRLMEARVILRNTVLMNHLRLGQRAKFVLRIKANPSAYDSLARTSLAPLREVIDLYRTGENYGLLAVIRVKSVSSYNDFLVKLYNFEDVLDTFSVIVLEERKMSTIPTLGISQLSSHEAKGFNNA